MQPRNLTAVVLLLVVTMSGGTAKADVGRIPASYAVSPNGGFTYSIPIWLPPGPNGVEPHLALVYDSTVDSTPSDNMPLAGTASLDEIPAGAGWVLAGLSAIQRTNQTVAQDGTAAGYSFSASDAYSLNGNRLRLTSSGNYGEDGSTYQTELANFSIVTAHGSTGDGPSYWTARGKDGLTYEYGNTSDSAVIEPNGSTGEIREWLLDKVTDTNGNSYTITYGPGTSGSTGIAVPVSISWTPSSSGSTDYAYTIALTYSSRGSSEEISGYVAGVQLDNDDLLHTITVSYDGTAERYYQLNYSTSSVTGRSLLASVDECSDSSMADCLTPTGFAYSGGSPGVGSSSGTAVSGATAIAGVYNFNGDGRSDILYDTNGTLYVAFANGSGFTQVDTGIVVGTSGYYVAGDLVGRGVDDILADVSGTWWRYTWDASSNSFTGSSTGIAAPAAGSMVELADVNGDGLPDLITMTPNPQDEATYYAGTLTTTLNTSSAGAFSLSQSSMTFDGLPCPIDNNSVACVPTFEPPADTTGDRVQDLMMSVEIVDTNTSPAYYTYTLIPQGSSYTVTSNDYTSGFDAKWNADRCGDTIYPNEVSVSACNGNPGLTIPLSGAFAVGAVDWNGDGLTDVLADSNGTLGIFTSTGTGISALAPTGIAIPAAATVVPLKVTGNGLPDIGIENGGTMTYYLHNAVVSLPDLLDSVTDGDGNTFTPSYTSISAAAYTMGSGAQDPESDWIGNLWVVQSLTLPDGIGGTYTDTYHYTDARWSRLREFEGFAQIQTTDSRNGEVRQTSYSLLFPLTGMVSEDDTFQSGGTTPISKTTYSNTEEALDSTQYNVRDFPYASNVKTDSYEAGGAENGEEITQSSTDYTSPDAYGNFSSIATTLTDEDPGSPYNGLQWVTTTSAQYADPSTGCLALPTQISVAKSAPNEATITRTTTYTNDDSYCRPTSEAQDAGDSAFDVTTALQYDAFGNVKQRTVTGAGMAARTWTYGWGTTGQFMETQQDPVGYADGYEEKMGYDYGKGVKTSDVIQSTSGTLDTPATTWTTDDFGRVTKETRADGTSLNWSYTACGSSCYNGNHLETVTETTEAAGGAEITDRSTFVDHFGRTLVVRLRLMDGSYSQIERQYDKMGNISQQSAPCSASACTDYWTATTYDALNRPVSIARPDAQNPSTTDTTNIAYAGRKTTTTGPTNEVTTQVVDVTGAVRETRDASGYGQNFTLDSDGNITNITDEQGNAITSDTYDYGGVGDYVATQTDRALGKWIFQPDALGEVTAYSDAKGQSFQLQYDALSRPVLRDDGVTSSGTETATTWSWGYTPSAHDVGKLDQAQTVTSDGTYTKQNTYDADGRLTDQAISIPGDSTYHYDVAYDPASGLISTLAYPLSASPTRFTLAYCYSYGILTSVANSSCTGSIFWQANTENAVGEFTQDTLGNGIVTQRQFSPVSGALEKAISGPGAGSASVQNQAYLYDALGDVVQRQDNNLGLTENFNYDNVNRLYSSTLQNASTTTTNLHVGYNPDGSMSQKTETGGTDTPVPYAVSWTSYNYPQTITATVSSTQTESATFDYGPSRQRWRMVYTEGSASETTEYIGALTEKVTSNLGTQFRYYIRGADGLAAIEDVDGSGTASIDYALSDQEGSISALLNSTGTVAANESFTAYGNRREASTWSGPPTSTEEATMDAITRQGFTGQTVLGQMALNHMNGRVEDPVTGTFLSPDPYISDPNNTQDYYRYAYTYNNPLSNVDPTGFDDESEFCVNVGQSEAGFEVANSTEAEDVETTNDDQVCTPILPQVTITPPPAPPPAPPAPPPPLPPLTFVDEGLPVNPSGPAAGGSIAMNSTSTNSPQQSEQAKTSRCNAARAQTAALANQFSSLGRGITWSGIGLVGASGVAALFAPEGAPAEYAGAAEGAGLIEAGNALSAIGTGLQGLAQTGTVGGGLKAAFTAIGIEQALGAVPHLFGGLTEASRTAAGALLSQTADALTNEESACGY